MSTKSNFRREEITDGNVAFSASRTTIETAFYGNNVEKVTSRKQAYELAKNAPGTVILDLPVYMPGKIDVPDDAKILLFNDGETVGRFAGARVILGEPGVDEEEITKVIREAAYFTRYKKMYHAQAYIGLNEDFIIKANLLIPETFENNIYSWLLNFQSMTPFYNEMYKNSKELGNEPDIYILSDPDYYPAKFPNGLAYFDPVHNCACLVGMRYFGEHKKGTLTLAWGVANRNGFASCHGGLKRMIKKDGSNHVMGVFGLSGSGKSTLTHAKHDGKYEVTVLHDDAYIISNEDGSAVALEPSYFDKTQDYPLMSEDNKYLVTIQNCGVTVDSEGKKVPVTEDIRNGNGRAVKSELWASNRTNKMEDPISSIVWLMKDASLPPVMKIEDPILASVMGACLATKRSTAEKLSDDVDRNALVFEPYANPFRTYALQEDYEKFKALFKERGVDCYILNTGGFLDKDIPKEITIGIIESIVDGTIKLTGLGGLEDVKTVEIEGYTPDFKDKNYHNLIDASIKRRIGFIESLKDAKGGRDCLPEEAVNALHLLLLRIKSL